MKIKTKLTIIFSLLFILFLVIVGSLYYYHSQKLLKKYTFHHLQHISKNLSDGINNFFLGRIISVNSASTSIYIKDRLAKINKNVNNYDQLPQRTQIIQQICNRLVQLKKEDPHISEFFILNPAGRVIASTDNNQIGKDKSDCDYFKKRAADITDIYLSPTLGVPTMIAFAPLIDENSKILLGIIAARIEIEKLNNMIRDYVGCFEGEESEAYVVNKDGLFIFGLLFEQLPSLSKKLYSRGIENCLDRQDSNVCMYPNYRDVEVIGACQYIKNKQWALIVELETKKAFKLIHNLRNWFLGIGAIGCLIIIVLIIKFSEQITHPLIRLTNASNEIADGNLDILLVEAKTGDEIEVLTESFNQMIKDLKKSRQKLEEWGITLEEKVKEKTQELNEKVAELEKFNKLAVGRELKMIELKKNIQDLENELKELKK